MVVLHRAGSGAAGHRESRATVRADAGTTVGDRQAGAGRGCYRELCVVRRGRRRVRIDVDRLAGFDDGQCVRATAGHVVYIACETCAHGIRVSPCVDS